MKKAILLSVVLSAGLWMSAYAADEAKLVEVHNKTCPISHEEVGKGGMTPHMVTYNGKTYRLCCAMCEKDFKKDPEKFVKIMEEEAAAEAAQGAPVAKQM